MERTPYCNDKSEINTLSLLGRWVQGVRQKVRPKEMTNYQQLL